MTGFRTFPAPLRATCIAISIFYKVEHILNVLIHFLHRDASLLPHTRQLAVGVMRACAGILARNACRKYRKWFSTDILTILEEFKVSQAACLMIPPKVAQRLAGFERTDRTFPIVYIVNSVSMSHTPAGKTDEARMQVCKRLGQVGTQTVLAAFKRILREKGNHIQMQRSRNRF